MSTDTAKKTMARAWQELNDASDAEDVRQAAEKAWRAAREAVYSLWMMTNEKKQKLGTLSVSAVEAFEVKYFRRMRGQEQHLTNGYHRALTELHGLCFYDGQCPAYGQLRRTFSHVDELIAQVEADSAGFSRKKKR